MGFHKHWKSSFPMISKFDSFTVRLNVIKSPFPNSLRNTALWFHSLGPKYETVLGPTGAVFLRGCTNLTVWLVSPPNYTHISFGYNETIHYKNGTYDTIRYETRNSGQYSKLPKAAWGYICSVYHSTSGKGIFIKLCKNTVFAIENLQL